VIVTLSERAERDLESILEDLSARAGPRVALRVIDKIERRCRSLDELPERGPLLLLGVRGDLRDLLEKPYLIIYRHRAQSVEVVAVLHGSRDLQAALRDTPDG
jgi:plasmid stabilization system protein ParE